MNNRCAILGASGHGKVVAEIAELNDYQVTFFDDRFGQIHQLEHWQVEGTTQDLLEKCSNFDLVVVAIGDNRIRVDKQRQLQQAEATFSVLAHPSAVISCYAKVGDGCVIMANATINPFAHIEEACVINTNASIDHDCHLGAGVHVSPGANLAGGVVVNSLSWVGIGAHIKQLVNVGHSTMIGAGAVVIADIGDNQVAVGVPAAAI